jgi:DNA replication protein DnaC
MTICLPPIRRRICLRMSDFQLPSFPSDVNSIVKSLEKLYLFHAAKQCKPFLEQAAKDNLSHHDFLARLLDEELAVRHERSVARLIRKARFPRNKTIDTFDWSHPERIPKALILAAFKLEFIERKEHLIFLGQGGLGKTHLAEALGFAACQREYKTLFTTAADMINHLVASKSDHSLERALKKFCAPKLLIIDELGYLPMDKEGRDLFFQVISKRSLSGSVIITTNKAFKQWGEVFQDNAVATAIAERIIEHGELIKIEGKSHRIETRRRKALGLESPEQKN